MTGLRKRALLIGSAEYGDSRFQPLRCTRADTAQLRQVLEHPAIGAFDSVEVLDSPTSAEMRTGISEFLESMATDELALLYISGHGARMVRSTGELFFITKDTEGDAIERTAVGASFVNEQLELCAAPQKVAILDCCYSGGFSLGFRTLESKSASTSLMRSRGVFVMSSSGLDERSWSGGAQAELQPSAFTGQLVEALRTGAGDTDNDGIVSADELFHYVNEQVRKLDLNEPQTPAYSADKVNVRIGIARSYTGPPLDPPEVRPPFEPSQPKTSSTPTEPWRQLLDYYRSCIMASESRMPLMEAEADDRYVCLTGSERLLSGVPRDTSIPLPDGAVDLVERAQQENFELWCGYPAVVLWRGPDGEAYPRPRFAPLFVRRVEVTSSSEGVRLGPVGTPEPHPTLAHRFMGPEQAEELRKTFIPHWRAGKHAELVQQLRYHLREDFGLPDVQPLRPGELAAEIEIGTPTNGARNAAILFLEATETKADRGLLRDLEYMADKQSQVSRTALASLLDGNAREAVVDDWELAAPLPLNEQQRAVLESAMRQRLTVATGPPGTGKSQLVANLVMTAVANRQKVLVASTNNRAVDEVWERCERLVPGCLVRTGSMSGERDHRATERASLQALLAAAGPSTNTATAWANLAQAEADLDRVRARFDEKARLETTLRETGAEREEAAHQLGRTPSELSAHFDDSTDLERLSRRAHALHRARLFGTWRRRSFLRKCGLDTEGDPARTCALVGEWANVERRWRVALSAMAGTPADDDLAQSLDELEGVFRQRSGELVSTVSRASARAGRRDIDSLLDVERGQRDWAEVRAVLKHVRGWAVTNHSVRRFPTQPALFDLVIVDEASQCTIPQVLPVLFRAKRALIIGDPMQLEPVVTLRPVHEAEARRSAEISASWLDEHRCTFHRHSAFHAFEQASGGSILLDEHFRCHPEIAELTNEAFYGGALTVLTDTRKHRRVDRPPILWLDVPGRATQVRGGSWKNDAEIARVRRTVEHLLELLPDDGTVGVVSPYRAQADAVEREWRNHPRVQVGTVHTFQGAERDAIVFSLVASAGMRPQSKAHISRRLHLWNVAITRARSHLLVVGDREFWRAEGGIGGALLAAADRQADHTDPIDGQPDHLLLRLHDRLVRESGDDSTVELRPAEAGHRPDALVHSESTSVAVLLDRGADDGAAPARHLRLQLTRRQLLTGEDGDRRVVRVPAWQLYHDRELL